MSQPITSENRARIIERAEEAVRLAERSLNQFVSIRRRLQESGVSGEEAVYNAVEFGLLLQFDFNCLLVEFVRYTGTWRGSLFARLLTLLIHQSAFTLRSVLGKDLQTQLSAAIGRADALSEVRSLHRAAGDLYERSETEYGEVRDGILAHRDKDADTRLRLVATMHDHEAVAELVLQMQDLMVGLAKLSSEYTKVLMQRINAP